TNEEAQLVQQALLTTGLPAVLLSNEPVFHSAEAVEMLAILHALATPAHEAAVRAALATTALGGTAPELATFSESAWEQVMDGFLERHTQWLEAGFFPTFRTLLGKHGVRPRLLALPDGERRLTNLLHLAELLHAAALANRLGPEALARWLAVQM